MGISIRLGIVFLIIIVFGHLAHGEKTNVNEITNYFNNEIGDKNGLESFLEHSKNDANQGISNKEGLKTLGISEVESEKKTKELNSIDANSLEGAGQQEAVKEEHKYYDSLEVNYGSPQIQRHKQDVDLIANASQKLMSRLIEGLKEMNVDCKQVKGNKEIEPEYYIDIQKEHLKDTIYNENVCEELHNKYNCTDVVTLKCVKTGFKHKDWQNKEIAFSGNLLFSIHRWDWEWVIHWKKGRYGWHVVLRTKYNVDQARELIAHTIGATIDQIHDTVEGPPAGRGIGNIHTMENDIVGWDQYVFKYKYRDKYLVCEQWGEDWNERCKLQ